MRETMVSSNPPLVKYYEIPVSADLIMYRYSLRIFKDTPNILNDSIVPEKAMQDFIEHSEGVAMSISDDDSYQGGTIDESENILASASSVGLSENSALRESSDFMIWISDDGSQHEDNSPEDQIDPIKQEDTPFLNAQSTEASIEPLTVPLTSIDETTASHTQSRSPTGNRVDQVGLFVCCEFMARHRQGFGGEEGSLYRKGKAYDKMKRRPQERLHAFKFVERLLLQGVQFESMEEVYHTRFGKHRTARSLKRYQTDQRSRLKTKGLLVRKTVPFPL